MRTALRLTNEKGYNVGWIDKDIDVAPHVIRSFMDDNDAPEVLTIDDADTYGHQLSVTLREIVNTPSRPLIIIGIRSGKVDAVINPAILDGIPLIEFTMPHLEDQDIGDLIDLLDRENRLGILQGKNRPTQFRIFRDQAGRQLLVSMIQATSGYKFEDKIFSEFDELVEEEAKHVYALVSVATVFRYSLARDEILLATGTTSNKMLNVIERLIKRNILIEKNNSVLLQARHRRIAEVLMNRLQESGLLQNILEGLAFLCATKTRPDVGIRSKALRLLIAVLNHEFLVHSLGVDGARKLYAVIEDILSWDYHYWLQRGSMEVQFGSIHEAENFLGQALSLSPDDIFVKTEWAYFLYKKAIDKPGSGEAHQYAEEAQKILDDLIHSRGLTDPYAYHVQGSQGLAWSRKGFSNTDEKQDFLRNLKDSLEEACRRHPLDKILDRLKSDIQAELLKTVTNSVK